MRPMTIVVILLFLFVLVLMINLALNAFFPTPDPAAFAGALGVPA